MQQRLDAPIPKLVLMVSMNTVSISPDDRYIVSANAIGEIYVWDWRLNKIIKSFIAHS